MIKSNNSLKAVIICGSNSKKSRSLVISEDLSRELSIWTIYLNRSALSVPLLDNEIIKKKEFPPSILFLLEKIREFQILIFVFPQYNCNLSGFFKNILDWCSIYSRKLFFGKRIILIGVSSTSAWEREFQQVSLMTFNSLGAEEIIFMNATEATDLTEISRKVQEYV